MPLKALGPLIVSTPGTKVSVTSILQSTEWDPANGPFKGHGIMFQAIGTNVGAVSVYQLQVSTYVLAAVLAIPTANFIPSFSAALTIAPNSITLSDLYLDAAQPGEGALVTILVS